MPDILLDVGDKAKFKGESNIEGFDDLIVCDSFNIGVNVPLDLGRGTNRTAGTVHISEVSFSRQFDSSSIPLLHATFSGEVFKKMTIHFLKAAGNDSKAHEEFLSVELKDAIFSNVSYSGASGGSNMMESLSVGFTAIEFEYKVQKDDGTLEGAKKASFDLLTQKSTKG
jgi:type VI secretion system secreted protein Hcp